MFTAAFMAFYYTHIQCPCSLNDNDIALFLPRRRKIERVTLVYIDITSTLSVSLSLSTSVHLNTLCSEKNTHSHFLSYLHELCVDLNKNCSKYNQGTVDSDNVKIRYSLRPMTSL